MTEHMARRVLAGEALPPPPSPALLTTAGKNKIEGGVVTVFGLLSHLDREPGMGSLLWDTGTV